MGHLFISPNETSGWTLPILFQFSHFQETNYGSIIKKSSIHHLFALACNQFTVENWSEQFVRGLEVWGRPSVLGVPVMLLLASLHHASLPARTQAHIHSLPSFSPSLKLPDTGDFQTTSIYPFIHCVKTHCPARNGINYCNYDASAVFVSAYFELSFGRLLWLCVFITLCPKSQRRGQNNLVEA